MSWGDLAALAVPLSLVDAADPPDQTEKEKHMNRLLTKALLASLFFVLATGTAAFAQLSGNMEISIPFKFYAGNTLLPAGKYTVRVVDMDDPLTLTLRNADDTVEVFLGTDSVTRADTPREAAFDFQKLGNKEFLSAIWVEGQTAGYQLEEPRLERKLEKAGMNKEKHSVKAHHIKA
jgi:hypothetical protein